MFDETQTIQRCTHDKENPYTMILNNLIRDQSISPNCRWLLIYLLSNKDGWKICIKQVINHLKGMIGRDNVYEIFSEAIEAGYIRKETEKHGNINQHVKYFVSETPKFKKFLRHPDPQDTESRETENQDYKKENSLKKENIDDHPRANAPADRLIDDDKSILFFKTKAKEKAVDSMKISAIYEALQKEGCNPKEIEASIDVFRENNPVVNPGCLIKYLRVIIENQRKQHKQTSRSQSHGKQSAKPETKRKQLSVHYIDGKRIEYEAPIFKGTPKEDTQWYLR